MSALLCQITEHTVNSQCRLMVAALTVAWLVAVDSDVRTDQGQHPGGGV